MANIDVECDNGAAVVDIHCGFAGMFAFLCTRSYLMFWRSSCVIGTPFTIQASNLSG